MADDPNQPPPFEGLNLFATDRALRDAVAREGEKADTQALHDFGARMGSAEIAELAAHAHWHVPALHILDRYGERIDEVEYHPAYHAMMRESIAAGISAAPWSGALCGHMLHAALEFLLAEVEPSVCCPITMTYAAPAALMHQPDVAQAWLPGILAKTYDPSSAPSTAKRGVTIGMAMTERQGGSDVRANTTRAEPQGDGSYRLTGHKWFCSAPMSDAFLTLAQAPGGLTCFVAPRFKPDGMRNAIHLIRLKDKLGDRANASAEIEYHGAHAVRVGEEGRGIATILDTVHHTRLDCAIAPAAYMRSALARALWHASHRKAFGKLLIDHALMRQVLADLAVESEAATALAFRVARSFDESSSTNPVLTSPSRGGRTSKARGAEEVRVGGVPVRPQTSEEAALFSRIATPVAKYWLNKRAIPHVAECMECHGGTGYIEEWPIARLYRQAPLNGIWEGSGNIICLDVLRALKHEPRAGEVFLAELARASGASAHLDRAINALKTDLASSPEESGARRLIETMALAIEGALLVQHAPSAISDAFCATRLSSDRGHTYGAQTAKFDIPDILSRAMPQ
jgi:putative acyl-CoA dehydrogenase